MAPHLPCNITNGGDRCSQLLHPALQLATIQGASWLGRSPLVRRRLHNVSLAPRTGQRSESCPSRLDRPGGVFCPSFSCPVSRRSPEVCIAAATVGIEGERSKQTHTSQGYIPYYATALVEGEGTEDLLVSLMRPAVGASLTPHSEAGRG